MIILGLGPIDAGRIYSWRKGKVVNMMHHVCYCIFTKFSISVQPRSWNHHTWVHTWTRSGRISGMVQILQQEVHPFVQAGIVHSIYGYRCHSSCVSNLKQKLCITINLILAVSLSLTPPLTHCNLCGKNASKYSILWSWKLTNNNEHWICKFWLQERSHQSKAASQGLRTSQRLFTHLISDRTIWPMAFNTQH